MAGPVTEGSIVAKLKLDSSDWNLELNKAEEKARALGAISPNIKVTVESAQAIADLAAVHEAALRAGGDTTIRVNTESTGAAVHAPGDTSSTNTVDTRVTGEASVVALTAAEEALRRASAEAAAANDVNAASMRSAAVAAAEAAAAQDALALAQQRAATAAREQEASNRQQAASQNTVTESGRGMQAQTAFIIAGIAALVATAGPVAGWAVGVAGALGAMGAAGILAVYGISQEIKSGTAVGQAYQAGLQGLKRDLDVLGATGAGAFLSSFQQGVTSINKDLPQLNSMVSQFGGMLGGTVTTALQGVLNAIRILNPLFVQAGGYIQQVAAGFLSWTQNGGLQQFANMAQATFPSVVNMIGEVLNGAMDLVGGLQSMGPAVLMTATAIGQFASFLGMLGPVLGPVAGGVLTAVVAFQVLDTVLPLASKAIALFSAETEASLGPVGWVVAAVGLAAAAFIGIAAATHQATQAQVDYTAAVQQDSGVIGEHVKAQTAKALADAGAFKAATSLGIAQSTLTQAALGYAPALATVKAHTDLAAQSYAKTVEVTGQLNGSSQVMTQKQKDLKAAVDTVTSSVNGANGSLKESQQTYRDTQAAVGESTAGQTSLARAYGATIGAYQAAKTAADSQKASGQAATLQMQLENDAAGVLKNTLDLLDGKTLSAADAQNAFDSQLSNMGTHVSDVGKQITFTTTNIGDMSAASVSLRGQLNSQVEAMQANVEAQVGLSGSTADSIPLLQQQRQQIIDNAVAHGVNRDAVTAYIDKIMQVPTSVPPTKLDVDAVSAQQKLSALQTALQGIPTLITGSVQIDTAQAMENVKATTNAVLALTNAVNTAGQAGGTATGAAAKKALGFATGGSVPGTGSGDTVPAMLTPGEYVVKPGPAAQYGSLLAAMNAGQAVNLPTSAATPASLPAASTSPAAASGTPQTITVVLENNTGVSFDGMITARIKQESARRATNLSTGLQRVNF
ncbi:hypothetical protein [Frondihabitans cladoniiphilus]|uniref:Uncharacterized protein n=1 Tax=Frondihabitans cladoniiphilus TaxID=715785 RepID=A0ABP8WEP6_9MICO